MTTIQSPSTLHHAASMIDEAIERMLDSLVDQGPVVGGLEQVVDSVLKERARLRRALATGDEDLIIKSMMQLLKKVARSSRKLSRS